MLTAIKHVSVPITDQDASLKFYTEKLGFKVILDKEFIPGQQRWIELEIPGDSTKLVLFTSDDHKPWIGSFFNIMFHSADVEKTYEDLKAKGVEFTQGPTEETWGSYVIFKDPDGNQFLIASENE